MSGYILKAADAVARLEVDWQRGDLAEGERVTRDLGWSVRSAGDDGPAIVSQSITPTRSHAQIEGGRPGRFHLVWCRARTNRERILCRSMVLRIAPVHRPN
jgi:hypothetical protein